MNSTLWSTSAEAKDDIARQNIQEHIVDIMLFRRQNVRRKETSRVDTRLTGNAAKSMKEATATVA
jgi:hypothetical protein